LWKEDIERPIPTENDDNDEDIRSTEMSQLTVEENKKNETLLSPECVPSKTTDDDQKSGNERDVRTKKEGKSNMETISNLITKRPHMMTSPSLLLITSQSPLLMTSQNQMKKLPKAPSLNCCLLLSPLKMTQE